MGSYEGKGEGRRGARRPADGGRRLGGRIFKASCPVPLSCHGASVWSCCISLVMVHQSCHGASILSWCISLSLAPSPAEPVLRSHWSAGRYICDSDPLWSRLGPKRGALRFDKSQILMRCVQSCVFVPCSAPIASSIRCWTLPASVLKSCRPSAQGPPWRPQQRPRIPKDRPKSRSRRRQSLDPRP